MLNISKVEAAAISIFLIEINLTDLNSVNKD